MLSKLNLDVKRDQEPSVKFLSLNIIKVDPYFGFPLKKDSDLKAYEKIHLKGYRCLSQYLGSKISMTVICPFGHTIQGLLKKLTIPCNNCKQCWDDKKLTPSERVLEIIESRQGKQLTPYFDSKTKITIKCYCENQFNIIPNDIMSGKWCNICAGNDVNEAKKKFYAILEAVEATPLTPYINSTTRVDIKCKRGHIYHQIPASTNMGHKCSHCVGNNSKDAERRFTELVVERGGTILSNYENNYTLVYVLCNKGHIFQTTLGEVAKGQWCARCNNRCPKQARERFIARVLSQGGEVLGEYQTVHDKVILKCLLGHIFDITPGHISKGQWCSKCRSRCPIQAQENFTNIVALKHGIILGEYINTSTKVRLQCRDGHIFEAKPNNITNGRWCKQCGLSESHGERLVREYLTDRNIVHRQECTFDWLPRKRYDFVLNYNGRNYIIEFDGIQHFEYSSFFHADENGFQERRCLDIIKTQSAINNGYHVIRIAHSDIDDIAKILDGVFADPISKFRLVVSDTLKYKWILDALTPN